MEEEEEGSKRSMRKEEGVGSGEGVREGPATGVGRVRDMVVAGVPREGKVVRGC